MATPALAAALAVGSISAMAAGAAGAQQRAANPVYVDDAPLAVETITRAGELARAGNEAEAVRVLQRLLDETPLKLAPAPGADGEGRYVTVRRRVHAALREEGDLLARYREVQEPIASAQLEEEGPEAVELARFLTPSGLEATLRLAQLQLEDGRFEAARITLEQLEAHPDFSGDARREAGELLRLIAGYLDRDELWQRAGDWLAAEGDEPEAFEAPERERVLTPLAPAPAIELDDVVGRPLHSREVLAEDFPLDTDAFNPWIMPIASGDEIIVNDGVEVSAWDRFTLQQRWRTRPEGWDDMEGLENYRTGRASRRLGMILRDASWAQANETHVVATTGYLLAYGRGGVAQRQGDPRVHAFDRRTGEQLWSWHPSFADSDLADTTLEGPPIIDGGLVILHGDRQAPQRRLWASALFAVDLYSGELRWQRPIASAGSLPYQTQAGLLGAATTLHRGVLYRVDPLGAATAIVAATGRPLWVRTLESDTLSGYDPAPPYGVSRPIIDGDSLVSLSPDRRDVLRLALDDGRTLASRSASALGSPRYLLRVGEHLAAIADSTVAFVPIAELERAPVERASLPSGEARGRAIVSGERLVLPIAGGLAVVDPDEPGAAREVPLERAGVLLVLEGQFAVASGAMLHSYMVWDVAEAILRRRMDAAPDDPVPAITFAELSLQAGRERSVVEAVDRALGAISRGGPEHEPAREHLYGLLLAAVRGGEPRPLAPNIELELLDRLGRAARTASERVGHLMELGASLERQGRTQRVIETYQRILLDDELVDARWAGPGLATRAGREATRRVRRIVAAGGEELYESHAAAAERSLEAMAQSAPPEALESMAAQYPAAAASARAWLLAAQRRQEAGEGRRAAGDLRRGLEVAQVAPVDPNTAAALAGGLAAVLLEQERFVEALRAIEALPEGATARVGGEELGRAEMERRASEAIAARRALPVIGNRIEEPVEVMSDWAISEPLSREPAWQRSGYALLERPGDEGLVLRAVEADPDGPSPTATRWTRELPAPARVVRMDPEALLLVVAEPGGPRLLRLDAQSGQTLWSADLSGQLAAAADPTETAEAPVAGPIRRDEPVLALGERTAVVAAPGGELLALDLRNGSVLWRREIGLRWAVDAEVGAGLAIVAGQRRGEGVVLAHDLADGRPVFEHQGQGGGEVRFVRLNEAGGLVVAVEGGLRLVDPIGGDVLWQIDEPWSHDALDAWLLDGVMYLLTAERELWSLDIASGRVLQGPIETGGALRPEGPLEARRVDGRLVVHGRQGVFTLDATGRLAGADVAGAGEPMAAAVGDDRVVVVDRFAPERGGGQRALVLDSSGRAVADPLRVQMGAGQEVDSVALLDGVVLLEATGGVVALSAPAD